MMLVRWEVKDGHRLFKRPATPKECSAMQIFLRKREYDKAISDLNEAIKINPKDASAFFNRGNAFELKGSLSDALALVKIV